MVEQQQKQLEQFRLHVSYDPTSPVGEVVEKYRTGRGREGKKVYLDNIFLITRYLELSGNFQNVLSDAQEFFTRNTELKSSLIKPSQFKEQVQETEKSQQASNFNVNDFSGF